MMSFEIETALLLILACALGIALGMVLRRRSEHRRRISLFAQSTFVPLAESGDSFEADDLPEAAPQAGATAISDGPSPAISEMLVNQPAPPDPVPTTPPESKPKKSQRRPPPRAGSTKAESTSPIALPDLSTPEQQPTLFTLPPISSGEAAVPGTRPPALAGPDPAGADDLKRLKGIGPLNERKLNGLGIYHFRQIAAWSDEEARWIGATLGFRGRVEREDWVGQARTLISAAPLNNAP
ncbi:hypothetical protein V5F77_20235 [Xanthobacter sp. DSM 24535]|uniref:hypothetical protein n=1 Tax=Roseixanthobacter psychrophilus TaxID=3119917 RepID=UPI003728510D